MRTWLINVLINIGTGILLAMYFESFRVWASDNILVVIVVIFSVSIVLTSWIESSRKKGQLEKEKQELQSIIKQNREESASRGGQVM